MSDRADGFAACATSLRADETKASVQWPTPSRAWRNRQALDDELREIVKRANVA
jgi:hypothetical protein